MIHLLKPGWRATSHTILSSARLHALDCHCYTECQPKQLLLQSRLNYQWVSLVPLRLVSLAYLAPPNACFCFRFSTSNFSDFVLAVLALVCADPSSCPCIMPSSYRFAVSWRPSKAKRLASSSRSLSKILGSWILSRPRYVFHVAWSSTPICSLLGFSTFVRLQVILFVSPLSCKIDLLFSALSFSHEFSRYRCQIHPFCPPYKM